MLPPGETPMIRRRRHRGVVSPDQDSPVVDELPTGWIP